MNNNMKKVPGSLKDILPDRPGSGKGSRIKLWQFKTLYIVDIIIIAASVMAFGLLAVIGLGLNENNAVIMVFMVPLMCIATGLATSWLLKYMKKHMDVLLDATQRVADGDLDVSIDLEGADEYTPVYENFNIMVKELKGTKEEMQASVNELAHEFKTPITSVSGFADYLLKTGEGIETPERMEYLKIIYDESMRLASLSQNMLLLSKVEACQIVTDKQEFDLSEQIKRSVLVLLPELEKKDIEIEADLPDITWYGNPELLEQVWINLINNAVKFTPKGGKISVSGEIIDAPLSCNFAGPEAKSREKNGAAAEAAPYSDAAAALNVPASAADRYICISVADTGIGMSKETASHIFEKYYQHDPQRIGRGNGIGLSIVARIVRLCDGSVEVESQEGKGSTFYVRLPVHGKISG